MKKNKALFAVLFSSVVIIVSFQNCAKQKFTEQANESSKQESQSSAPTDPSVVTNPGVNPVGMPGGIPSVNPGVEIGSRSDENPPAGNGLKDPTDCKKSGRYTWTQTRTCSGAPIAASVSSIKDENACAQFCEKNKGTCCSLIKGSSQPTLKGDRYYCYAHAGSMSTYNWLPETGSWACGNKRAEPQALDCRGTAATPVTLGQPASGKKTCVDNVGHYPEAYLDANDDVRKAGMDAWTHYRNHGCKEGRNQNSNPFGLMRSAFVAENYLLFNPDLVLAGVDPWEHYQTCGIYEERRLNPTSLQSRIDR